MEEKKVFTKDECLKILDENDYVEVVFIKKDGSERTMVCTRNMKLVDESLHPKENSKPANIDNGVPVIDINANGWRRFNYDSVISIKPAIIEG